MPETDEGVIHTVTSDPVPDQKETPEGTHIWELSWSRRRAMMRARRIHCPHDDCFGDTYEWWFKKAAGKPKLLGGNPDTGRMLMLGRVKIQHRSGHPFLQFYKPKGMDIEYGEVHQCQE